MFLCYANEESDDVKLFYLTVNVESRISPEISEQYF